MKNDVVYKHKTSLAVLHIGVVSTYAFTGLALMLGVLLDLSVIICRCYPTVTQIDLFVIKVQVL